MALITKETKLAHIISVDANVITVFNRFNIRLGVGDKTVSGICDELNLDPEFMLTVINTFLNEDYVPGKVLTKLDAEKVVRYLKHTNVYTLQYKLPNIERHFNLLLSRNEGLNNNLSLIRGFFFKLKEELIKSIEIDNNIIFPRILSENIDKNNFEGIDDNTNHDDSVEQKFADLKNMLILHLEGEYDENLCNAVLFAIISLEKDIKQNNRIKVKMLLPYIESI